MKSVLLALSLAFFLFQPGAFSAESKETPELKESLKQEIGNNEKSDTDKQAANQKKPETEKDSKSENDDDDVDAIKSWKAQFKPNTDTNRRNRMETSQTRKSLKSTYKEITDKDMRSAGFRLNN